MMTWLSEQASAISTLNQYPKVFLLAVIIFLPIYWLHMRMLRRFTRKAVLSRFDGLNESAAEEKRHHDLGIGEQTVFVLRRRSGDIGLIAFALVFFGGCALLLGWSLVQQQESRTPENALGLAICLGFVGLCGWALLAQRSRIELFADRIEHRRLLRRRRSFLLSEIDDVEKLGNTPGEGVILVFRDGRRLQLPASFAGYRDALQLLWSAHPKIAGHVMLADATKTKLRSAKNG